MLPKTPTLPGRGHGRQFVESPPEMLQRLHNIVMLKNLSVPRVRTPAGVFSVYDTTPSTSKGVKAASSGQFSEK